MDLTPYMLDHVTTGDVTACGRTFPDNSGWSALVFADGKLVGSVEEARAGTPGYLVRTELLSPGSMVAVSGENLARVWKKTYDGIKVEIFRCGWDSKGNDALFDSNGTPNYEAFKELQDRYPHSWFPPVVW